VSLPIDRSPTIIARALDAIGVTHSRQIRSRERSLELGHLWMLSMRHFDMRELGIEILAGETKPKVGRSSLISTDCSGRIGLRNYFWRRVTSRSVRVRIDW
jgi:hypothetical protein